MKLKDFAEPLSSLEQPPTIKVIARRPNQQQARLTARSKKKERFSSDDFFGFYSPTHKQYDSLQKGKLDMSKVLPRTPSKEAHESRNSQSMKLQETSCLIKSSPTKSQLRVRLKLNDIGNDLHNLKSKKYQGTQNTEKTERNKEQAENLRRSSREGAHIHPQLKETAESTLQQENRKLRDENFRLIEITTRMKQNLEDCHSKITQWQKGEIQREIQIRNLQQENAELKAENQALHKNSAAKEQLNALLQRNVESLREKLEKEAKQLQIQRQRNQLLQNKIVYLEEISKTYIGQLQRERERCKYLEIQLQVSKQKKFEMESAKNLHEEKVRLLEDNRKWRHEAVRLKNKLASRDEIFELSPQRS